MRKAGLKKKTGCLRCKRRHKRCDELKPKCSYCARWQLECIWPEITSPETRTRATTSSSQNSDGPDTLDVQTIQSPLAKTDDNTYPIHPLHNLPHRRPSAPSTGSQWVQQFFLTNAGTDNPYDTSDIHSQIVLGWPEFAFLEKAACAIQVASWAGSSVQRREASMGVITALDFETLTISRLRRAISPRAPVSEEILLTVAVYFIISAAEFFDTSQLRNMVEGVNVMVMSFGGIDAVLQKMKASTVLAVLRCDILGSLLNAEQHFFVQLDKPERPQLLTNTYKSRHADIDISRYIAPDVYEVFDELGLLLYSKQPSNQRQALTAQESHYFTLLDQWIDYRLGVLQASHVNDCSISEIFTFALIILKQEIITETAQHSVLVSTLLTGLQTSISHFQTRVIESEAGSNLIQTIILWTSLIALTGIPLTLQRLWFADYIHNILNRRYGPIQDWPDSWERDFRVELQQFLWHERIANRYAALCTEIRGHQQARGFT